MAKNWTVSEAYVAIKNNDKAAIDDIGRRYPCLLAVLAKQDMETIMSAMPDYVTARKMEGLLKGDIEETEDSDDGDAPAKKTKQTDEEKRAKAKARREARKAKKEAEMETDEEEEEEIEEVEGEPDYSSMNAIELYKLCKKRGLKVEQKQKASVYIKALKEADEDEEDDDWGDEEEEEVKEEPKEKKTGKRGRPPKNETKKPKVEEDEDEDWDI